MTHKAIWLVWFCGVGFGLALVSLIFAVGLMARWW
jgi:hypothetical protein